MATQEFYAKTVAARTTLGADSRRRRGSTKMLNDKIVELTSNVEVAFATVTMATAKSLSEIAKLQMDFIRARYANDGAERICRPVGARHSARVRGHRPSPQVVQIASLTVLESELATRDREGLVAVFLLLRTGAAVWGQVGGSPRRYVSSGSVAVPARLLSGDSD